MLKLIGVFIALLGYMGVGYNAANNPNEPENTALAAWVSVVGMSIAIAETPVDTTEAAIDQEETEVIDAK